MAGKIRLSVVWSTTTAIGPVLVQEKLNIKQSPSKSILRKTIPGSAGQQSEFTNFLHQPICARRSFGWRKRHELSFVWNRAGTERKGGAGLNSAAGAGAGGGGRLPQCNWFSSLQSHPFTTTAPAESTLCRIVKTRPGQRQRQRQRQWYHPCRLWRFVKLQDLPTDSSRN